jgi:hypothetical protein
MLRQLLNNIKAKLKAFKSTKAAPAQQASSQPETPTPVPAAAAAAPAPPAAAIAAKPAMDSSQQPQPGAGGTPQQKVLAPIKDTAAAPTLSVVLQNNTSSGQVYAYFTGQAIDNNFSVYLLQSDGQTPYYPSSPSATGAALTANCSIALGAPGTSITVTIPRTAGGRIWFSIESELTFLLNPGPALVEPSVTNPSDPNINKNWAFAEFTWNEAQLYANISFVDFVSLPIALSLLTTSGSTSTVEGLEINGFNGIVSGLQQQTATDGVAGWANLVQNSPSGQPLRVVSPTLGMLLHPNDFNGYFDPYINSVLSTYESKTFSVQVSQTFTGNTTSNSIVIGSETFSIPTAADIFGSNSGPFTTGSDAIRNQLIPQLAAAFNRSTLVASDAMPAPASVFYTNPITNHYSRIVHENTVNGRGYAFPYDDVPPSGGADVSGFVNAGNPQTLTVTLGGVQ